MASDLIYILYNGNHLISTDGKPIVFRDPARANAYCVDMAKGIGVDPEAFTTTPQAPAQSA